MTNNVVHGTRFFIVGFMGVGKSTVGQGVAKRLGVPFYDLDEEIEQDIGKKIHEIFAAAGEGSFRAIESERLREIVKREPGVIATGGGTFTLAENRKIIGSSGVSVWLDAPTELVIERGARGRHRPLWRSPEQVRTLLDERLPNYSKADIRFDINALPLAEVTAQLAIVLQSYCEN